MTQGSDDGRDLDRTLSDLGIATDDDASPRQPEATDLEAPQAVAATVDDGDARERTESFLVQLLLNFDPAFAVDVARIDDEVSAEIHGGDAGKLIGKNGRTLAALEQIVNAVVNRPGDETVRVNVDVGGYKRRRDDRLRQEAQRVADQVRKQGEPVELEPMSAGERRVIHMAVASDPDVVSESLGEGRDRRVVLMPAPVD
ncbi:MAG: R3H domain-containing nucleic acid-binding protein [Trueperaceae bacterium]